jgi:hypothetical protein
MMLFHEDDTSLLSHDFHFNPKISSLPRLLIPPDDIFTTGIDENEDTKSVSN